MTPAAPLLVLVLLLWPASALASPLFELVGAGLGTGGFNARGTGASSASAYFNPALLPRAKQGLELGWLVLHDAIDIHLDARSPVVDVPLSSIDRVRTGAPPYPTRWLDQGCTPATGRCVRDVPAAPRQQAGSSGSVRGYQLLGLVNHVIAEHLSLGLYALVPLSSFTQAHAFFADEREQFFSNSLHPELYADRLTPVSLAFGVGGEVYDGLSLGLSFTLGLNNGADAGAYVGNSGQLAETLQLSTKVDVSTTVAPHLAFAYDGGDRWTASLVVHSPQKMVTDTEFGIYLPNGDLQRARRSATHAYLPWITALAGTYDLIRSTNGGLRLAGTLTLERWSRYLDRQGTRPAGRFAWHDIVTGSLGLRYTRAALASYLDLTMHPSPVPSQIGRSNYVDNDRYGAVAGVNYELRVPRLRVGVRFGAQAQVQVLTERYHRKLDPTLRPSEQLVRDEWPDDAVDVSTGQPAPEARGLQTNNPGWPGFRSRGYLAGGMLTVALLY